MVKMRDTYSSKAHVTSSNWDIAIRYSENPTSDRHTYLLLLPPLLPCDTSSNIYLSRFLCAPYSVWVLSAIPASSHHHAGDVDRDVQKFFPSCLRGAAGWIDSL